MSRKGQVVCARDESCSENYLKREDDLKSD